jgi:hypothetical protein
MKLKAFRDPETRFFLTIEAAPGAAPGAGDAPPGAGGGGEAAPGGSPGGDPWYQPHVGSLDKDTLAYLDGKKFPSMLDALKSGAQSDRMARERNVIARPDPEKLGEWEGWGAMGYDADKAKYAAKIKPPKMPNNAQHDAGLMDAFVGFAHENHVPPAAAEKMFHGMNDFVNARLSELASKGIKDSEVLDADLRKEWGTEYAQNQELARRAFKAFGVGVDDSSELEKVIGSPRLLKLFNAIGKKMGEANLVSSDGFGAADTSPATAEAELRRLEGDDNFMKIFRDPRHPQQKDHKAKWMRLVAIAAGEKPKS